MSELPMEGLQSDLRAHVAAFQQLAAQIRSTATRDGDGQLDADTGKLLGALVQLTAHGSLLADRLTCPGEDPLRVVDQINQWISVAVLAAEVALAHPLGAFR